MAELDKWLHIPGFENVDIDVDMLDFPFIENCSDWVKLAKIVHILKSGQEGYYPEVRYCINALSVVVNVDQFVSVALDCRV